jgi:hypothetical protein
VELPTTTSQGFLPNWDVNARLGGFSSKIAQSGGFQDPHDYWWDMDFWLLLKNPSISGKKVNRKSL